MSRRPASERQALRLGLWLGFLVVGALMLVWRLEVGFDLGLFLPAPQTPAQRVLIERLGEGPGSRFIIVGFRGLEPDRSEEVLDASRTALEETGRFARVLSGSGSGIASSIPEPLWSHRFLLSDQDFSKDGLTAVLRERLADLGLLAGAEVTELLRSDPGFLSVSILDGLNPTSSIGGQWVTADGDALLIVETLESAFDLGHQQEAIDTILDTLAGLRVASGAEIILSGMGVFGAELQDTIRQEARERSVLASVALALTLLVVYRRWNPLWTAAVPLVTGALAGLVAVALGFDRVHGITLAFGFTLLGIAIDYPIHLLSHARNQSASDAVVRIWPTLRLGMVSTLLAYVAIAVSGSEGLAQLGVFSCFGVAAAGITTRWILPILIPPSKHTASPIARPAGLRFAHLPVVVGASVGLLVLTWQGDFWTSDLSTLSPVPAKRLEQDQRFRQALGTPDLRYVLVVRDSDLETVLQRTETLSARLGEVRAEGLLSGWQSIAGLLPSRATQIRRRSALPDRRSLELAMASAVSSTPFRVGAFGPFLDAVEASRTLAPLEQADFSGSPLESLVDNLLYKSGAEYVSTVALFGLEDADRLEQWLGERAAGSVLVDFRTASETLVAGYRDHALLVLQVALLGILIVLLWQLTVERALWSLCCVLSVLMLTAGLVYSWSGPLNLYHLMALLLVAGQGLDYALFLSREDEEPGERGDTRHAVLASCGSTLVAFSILGGSAIPALHSLGVTVALGTVLSYGVARLGLK